MFDLNELGQVYEQMLGTGSGVIDAEEQAIVYYELASLTGAEGTPDALEEACGYYQSALDLYPGFRDARAALLCLSRNPTVELSVRIEILQGLAQRSDRREERLEMVVLEAELWEREEEPEQALACIAQGLEQFPGASRLLYNRLRLERRMGLLEEAHRTTLELARAIDDEQLGAALAYEAGWYDAVVRGDYNRARMHVERGLKHVPLDGPLLERAAQIADALGDAHGAARHYEAEAQGMEPGPEANALLYDAARLLAYRLGQPERAMRLLERVVEEGGTLGMIETIRVLGLEFGVGRDLVDVYELLVETAKGRDTARYLWLQGEELGERGEDAWTRAAEAGHGVAEVALALSQGRLGEAEDPVAALLEGTARERVMGALLLIRQGKTVRAEQVLRETLELAPLESLGPLGAGEVLREMLEAQGRVDDEVALLEWLFHLESPRAAVLRVHRRRAHLLSRLSEFSRAADSWRVVLRFSPGDGHALMELGSCLMRCERYDEVVMLLDLERDLEKHSRPLRSEVIRWERANLLSRWLDRRDDALDVLADGLEQQPDMVLHSILAARLLIEAGDVTSLARHLERSLEYRTHAAERARIQLRLGMIYEHQIYDLDRAADCYRSVVEADPDNLAALDALLRVELALDNEMGVVTCLERLAMRERDSAYRAALLFRLGSWLEHVAGRHKDACHAYGQALAADSDLLPAWMGWERTNLVLGRTDVLQGHLEGLLDDAEDRGLEPIELLERMLLIVNPEREGWVVQQLLTRQPDHTGALLRLWRRASARNQPSAIVEVLRALSGTGSSSDNGAILTLASMFETAERGFSAHPSQPLEDSPDLNAILRSLANARVEGAWSTQLEVFRSLLSRLTLADERVTLLTSVATLLSDAGQFESASHYVEEALRADERFLPAIKLATMLAEREGKRKRLAEAVEREAALAQTPSAAIDSLLRAADVRLRQMGDVEGAERALLQVLDIDPAQSEAFERLNDVYRTQKQLKKQHALLRRRAASVMNIDEKKRALIKAAELAYTRLKDKALTVEDHLQIIHIDPQALRSYRVIADIYIETERWKEAVDMLEGVLRLTQDKVLLGRTTFQLGTLLEERLRDHRLAIKAYLKSLQFQPDNTEILERLAKIYKRGRLFKEQREVLRRLVELERVPRKRQEHLLALGRLAIKHFDDLAFAESCIVEAREVKPDELSGTREMADAYARRGLSHERERFLLEAFDELRDRFCRDVSSPEALLALCDLAHMMQAKDRMFTLSSVLCFVGSANEEQEGHYRQVAREMGLRFPARPIPTEKTAGIFAPGLHPEALYILRHANRHISRSRGIGKRLSSFRKKKRVSPTSRQELQAFLPFGKIYGGELPTVYVVGERGEVPVVLLDHDNPAVVVDERDLAPELLPQTLMRVASGCAALSMGTGAAIDLRRDAFRRQFYGLVMSVAPSVSPELRADLGEAKQLAGAVPRKVAEAIAPHVRKLLADDELTQELIERQYHALLFTHLRLGLVGLFDPRPGLTVIARDGDAGVYDVVTAIADVLRFLVSERYFELRRDVGLAL